MKFWIISTLQRKQQVSEGIHPFKAIREIKDDFSEDRKRIDIFFLLKFWTLNFNAPQLLQKMFAPHVFPFNNVYLYVYYHPSKFVGLVEKHPVYSKMDIFSFLLYKIQNNFTHFLKSNIYVPLNFFFSQN